MQAELDKLKKELSEMQSKLTESMNAKEYEPGMIHNVFFWLKPNLSEADKNAFIDGLKSLAAISTVRKCFVGPPAATEERGVVDNTFSYALLVHFDDIEGQNAYQVDPIHLKFVEDHKDKWVDVKVYDNTLME